MSTVALRSTDEDLRGYRASLDTELRMRVRWGCFAALPMCALAGVTAQSRFSDAPALQLLAPLGVVAAVLATLIALTFVTRIRSSSAIIVVAGAVIAAAIGVAGGATGGLDSPITYNVPLLWVFGALVTTRPVRIVALDIVLQLALLLAAMAISGQAPIAPIAAFWPFALAVAGLCVVGAHLRDQAGLTTFVARRRFEQLAGELAESRNMLRAMLRTRVHDRARELAALVGGDAPPRRRIKPGLVLRERFEILDRIGSGGMGVVYLGVDRVTGVHVAIKMLSPRLLADAAATDRFAREAIAATACSHPAIIHTLHVDVTDDGQLFQVSEYADGTPLSRALSAGAFPAAATARIGSVVADALAAAHRAGVIHRDIKPSNLILVSQPPGVRVLDFGLAKLVHDIDGPILTAQHQPLGTPEYMSPEQVVDASQVGPSTDIYSLGLTLYEMLTGVPAVLAINPVAYMQAHIDGAIVDVREHAPHVPPDLASLVMQCLARDPAQRPPAVAVAATLRTIADRLDAAPVIAIDHAAFQSGGVSNDDATLVRTDRVERVTA